MNDGANTATAEAAIIHSNEGLGNLPTSYLLTYDDIPFITCLA